jgi:hypothetical protein
VTIRKLIAGSLWTGFFLFLLLVVCGALWGILAAVGDAEIARVARGIAVIALVCGLLNFVAMVVLVALAQVTSPAPPDGQEHL